MILGIDEVGRGPWAGPLVVGAVVLGGAVIEGLTDSKKLTKKRREELDIVIRRQASGIGLGWVTASEIDEIGLSASLVLATKRAVEQVTASYHEIIIDGMVNFLKDTAKGQYVTTLKKADLLIPSVSAASVVAKVARDRFMSDQDSVYPGYKFGSHAGYGTAAHLAAINRLGVTPLHRLSFAPLAKYRTGSGDGKKVNLKPTAKSIGDRAEDEVANYLLRLGHEVIGRNWRTRFCEIDVISKKGNTIYFNEVKYRSSGREGGGLAAITPTKLRQMKFAAEYYVLVNRLSGVDMRLAAVSAGGQPPEVERYLEIV